MTKKTLQEIDKKAKEIMEMMEDLELSEEEILARLDAYAQTDPEAYQDVIGGFMSLLTPANSNPPPATPPSTDK